MKEYFDIWNEQKKLIHEHNKVRYCKPRDITQCALGQNIGVEENGGGRFFKRPVVVLKCFGKISCLVAPITSSFNEHELRIPIGKVEDMEASVLLSQIKVVDTKRIYKKIGEVSTENFEKIKEAFNNLL